MPEKRPKTKGGFMKKQKGDPENPPFNFSRAQRVTPEETEFFRKAYENTFGVRRRRRGRPAKAAHHKYRDIHLKLHPRALAWTRTEAKRRGIGYQTLINEILLHHAA
jgi:uncharacterized protein (DUF4415 family)